MKQAHPIMTLEQQVGIALAPYQERRAAPDKTILGSPLSQQILVAVLCNRLARAISAQDSVSAGQARGALVRLSMQNRVRLARVQRA